MKRLTVKMVEDATWWIFAAAVVGLLIRYLWRIL